MPEISKIFGEPGQGTHEHYGGIAIWDAVFTVIAAILLSWGADIPLWRTVLGLFIVGQGAHLAFGVDTTATKWLIN